MYDGSIGDNFYYLSTTDGSIGDTSSSIAIYYCSVVLNMTDRSIDDSLVLLSTAEGGIIDDV